MWLHNAIYLELDCYMHGMCRLDFFTGLPWMQVLEDVRDECGRHGAVVAVKVPRPPQPELSAQMFNTGNYGKVRVQG